MTVLPSQIYLCSSRSTPECYNFFHHAGEMEHESIFQKGWLSPSIHPVRFLQNKQCQGPIACIAPPSVRIPSNTTYEIEICIDLISSTVSIQILVSTIKFIITGNDIHDVKIIPLHWKLEILNAKLEICQISPPNINFLMCLMHISIESYNYVVSMTWVWVPCPKTVLGILQQP